MFRINEWVSRRSVQTAAVAMLVLGLSAPMAMAKGGGHGGGHGGHGGHSGGHYSGGHYSGGHHYGGQVHHTSGHHYYYGNGGIGYGYGYNTYYYPRTYATNTALTPYATNQYYVAADGYRYQLWYNPATGTYFYYPIVR